MEDTFELPLATPRVYSWGDEDLPAQYWWVYPGPFKDRFSMDYAAIAASDHSVCRAFIALVADRQYIDLKGDVATLFDALIAAGQPEPIAAIPSSGPMTELKKSAVLGTPTTEHERYVKGLPEPMPAEEIE